MKAKSIYLLIGVVGFIFISVIISHAELKMKGLQVVSPAFKHNEYIPKKFTCDGEDINPPLLIENVPSGTKSLALIVDDPDAPVRIWVHWVVWNIYPNNTEIKENSVPKGAQQGINDFRKHDYGGPCPPSGTHRYFFKLYALDTMLNLSSNSKKGDLEKAMKGHILEKAEIIGLYKR
jgi:Raf kinase inhibitor-like YbhB/YbcL family protein